MDLLSQNEGLNLPVEGEEGGGGDERPWRLKELRRNRLLHRQRAVAGSEGGGVPSLVDEEGFCPGEEARVAHKILRGFLQQER